MESIEVRLRGLEYAGNKLNGVYLVGRAALGEDDWRRTVKSVNEW